MAGIPPNWLGSVAQTAGAQSRAAVDKAREAANAAVNGTGNFVEKLQSVIESSDRDSQVYSDAEGAGSQGRTAEEEDQAETEPDTPPDTGAGLDVEA